MGWRFHRSINLGPLRINLSKRGMGVSLGAGPLRVGRSSRGTTYTSARIPGTGLSYRTESGGSGRRGAFGCTLAVLGVLGILAIAAVAVLMARSGS